MSSPPWYMHLPYEISLLLQTCTRNRISPSRNMYISHIEMKKTLQYNDDEGKGEMKARDESTNNNNDAWGLRDEWENEAQS